MALPTSGSAWTKVYNDATSSWGPASIADQNSKHDAKTMAGALVCVRTGDAAICDKAQKGVLAAIGTEFDLQPGSNEPGAWLEVGRNLTAYVIAADLLGLRADGNPNSAGTRVESWIRGWLTKQLPDTHGKLRQMRPFGSGSNADAQEGAAYSAVAAYLRDSKALARAWNAYRYFLCDPTATNAENINLEQGVEAGWAHDNQRPCAVNPKGAKKTVPAGLPGAGTTNRIDGAIINDMRRGGNYQHPPGWTQYPWTGLAGLVPAAVILHRAGYPAFEVVDRAIWRTFDYLWWLRSVTGNTAWFDGDRGSAVIQLVNHYYKTNYPVKKPVDIGHVLGHTDWTHP